MNVIEHYKRWDRFIYLTTLSASRVGGGLLVGMMLLIACDVFLRFFFNKPVPGTFELVEIMMGATVSMSIAYCGYKRGHVAVEVITEILPLKLKSVFELAHGAVCAVFFATIAVKGAQQAGVIRESQTVTTLLEIPIFPFIWMFVIGSALLTLVYCKQVVMILSGKKESS